MRIHARACHGKTTGWPHTTSVPLRALCLAFAGRLLRLVRGVSRSAVTIIVPKAASADQPAARFPADARGPSVFARSPGAPERPVPVPPATTGAAGHRFLRVSAISTQMFGTCRAMLNVDRNRDLDQMMHRFRPGELMPDLALNIHGWPATLPKSNDQPHLGARVGLAAEDLADGGEAAVEDDGDDEGPDESVGPELIH